MQNVIFIELQQFNWNALEQKQAKVFFHERLMQLLAYIVHPHEYEFIQTDLEKKEVKCAQNLLN